MTVNKYLLPILTLAAMFGAVAIAKAAGFWAVSGKQMINASGMTSGNDIRGWMTLEQISQGFNIPKEELYLILEMPTEIPPETALKDLETVLPGFEVSAVREAVDAFLAGASPPANEPPAQPTLNPEPAQVEAVITPHAPQGAGNGSGTGDGSGPTPLPPGQVLAGSELKGRHTLAEIAEQCQIPLDALYAALGLPEDLDPHTRLKDLADQGLISEVQAVRDVVTELQGK